MASEELWVSHNFLPSRIAGPSEHIFFWNHILFFSDILSKIEKFLAQIDVKSSNVFVPGKSYRQAQPEQTFTQVRSSNILGFLQQLRFPDLTQNLRKMVITFHFLVTLNLIYGPLHSVTMLSLWLMPACEYRCGGLYVALEYPPLLVCDYCGQLWVRQMFCGRDLWWTIPLHIFHWSCWDTPWIPNNQVYPSQTLSVQVPVIPVPAYGSTWVVLWLLFCRSAPSTFPDTWSTHKGLFRGVPNLRLYSEIDHIHLSI